MKFKYAGDVTLHPVHLAHCLQQACVLMKLQVSPIEPAAIWANKLIVFDRSISPTQNVVLSQGWVALASMIRRIDRLYELLHAKPEILDYYLDPEIPQLLTEICAHQAVASSIMFNDSKRFENEKLRPYKLRMERFEYVMSRCTGTKIDILTSRTIRNELIHIDQHLEKAMRSPNTGWSIDIAMAYRDQFSAPNGLKIGFCRTFIASEEVLIHLGNEISVRTLREEATAVLAAVFGVPPTPPPSPFYNSRPGPPTQPTQNEA